MARVDFDFNGSLQLARDLWNLANVIRVKKITRGIATRAALVDWSGPSADHFRLLADREPDTFSDTEDRVRAAAESWAEAWARATDEQNRRDYAEEVAAEQASRSGGERFVDFFVGDDSFQVVGPAPGPVPVPTGPTFAPTD